jgi:hypothetical protein
MFSCASSNCPKETLAMVELQLEKLSPLPVTQIVWTLHVLAQAPAENIQSVIVVIVERSVVEEFLGKLETHGYLADRLEVPMLDQLEATAAAEEGAWLYPLTVNSQSAALIAWWIGGALRSLSFILLPLTGDRTKSLKDQIIQLTWAGELEGWLTAPPVWHLVAEGATVGEWETILRAATGQPVPVVDPLPPAELAAHTARRATTSQTSNAALLPMEFSTRYQQQFMDRLWLRFLMALGVLYVVCVLIYFMATFVLGIQTGKVEQQVAAVGGSYTNALQLQARYDVLKERQDLKFAALDCWQVVAEHLPPSITLQRFGFGGGQTLSLAGTAPADQVNTLLDFNSAMQKAVLNGKPMFAPGGETVHPRQSGNTVSWNFTLQLLRSEDAQ